MLYIIGIYKIKYVAYIIVYTADRGMGLKKAYEMRKHKYC